MGFQEQKTEKTSEKIKVRCTKLCPMTDPWCCYIRRPQPSAGGARPRKSGVKHEATLGSRLA